MQQPKGRRWSSDTLGILLLFLVYVATARLGLRMDAVAGFATLVWPPTGISLAVLLLFGKQLWPGVLLGALTVNLLAGAPLPVALDPDFLDARRQLALLLVAAERWDENLEQCREILKRDARDWNARYSLGQTLIRKGLEEEGRRELQRAQETRRAEQARQDAEKAIGRGVAALRAGKPEAAAAEFRAALETDARSALAHMYLGMALASLDQRQDGLAELDRAVELEPQGARARHNRGTLLLQLGRVAEARADFDRALELDPHFAETHNNLGMILAATGDPRAALEHFRLATEIDPGYVEGLFNLGLCLRSLGRLDEAIAALRRAARRAPDNRQVQSALETCLKERGAAPKRNPGPRP